ncbi:alkaline shock response membrane anchor protein AmaP [Nonomuraea longicatena]|uniref:Alkaline shock response membrane anchor protein AmaP n=1 Tax=Nonomuraea longicatena TaxID=83682 RepID=A0ABP3ZGU6_9ACTN
MNRFWLAVVGLALLALGGFTLVRGLGALPQEFAPAHEPLVNGPVREVFHRFAPWIWWVVAAAAIVLALLALCWLYAQGRSTRLSTLRLGHGPGGGTEVAAGGVAQAVAAEVAASPAVLGASADLGGSPRHPTVRLRLVADERTPMSEIRRQLSGVAIPHVRDALETDRVPAVARVTLRPGQVAP